MKISNGVKKSLLVLFLIIVISFINANFVSSQFQPKELEIKYPTVPRAPTITSETPINEYVKYIFNFAIFFSGFIALGVLIYGGFKYFTSIGSPEKINDAKEWITGAIAGLLILFASYLVLSTINPELVILREPKLVPTIEELGVGVMACKEKVDAELAWKYAKQYRALPVNDVDGKKVIKDRLEPIMKKISEVCYYITSSGDVLSGFDNQISYAYLIAEEETYGTIFYKEKGFRGDYDIKDKGVFGQNQVIETPVNVGASSVRPFVWVKPDASHKAVLYEEIDFNFGLGTAEGKQLKELPLAYACTLGLSFTPQSIEIKGDDIFVILYKTWGAKDSQIFTEPGDRDLNNNERIHKHVKCNFFDVFYSCTESAVMGACIFPAKIY